MDVTVSLKISTEFVESMKGLLFTFLNRKEEPEEEVEGVAERVEKIVDKMVEKVEKGDENFSISDQQEKQILNMIGKVSQMLKSGNAKEPEIFEE